MTRPSILGSFLHVHLVQHFIFPQKTGDLFIGIKHHIEKEIKALRKKMKKQGYKEYQIEQFCARLDQKEQIDIPPSIYKLLENTKKLHDAYQSYSDNLSKAVTPYLAVSHRKLEF